MIRFYIMLGIFVAIIAGGVGMYVKGRMDGKYAIQLDQLKSRITQMEQEKKVEEAARALDAIQAKLDTEDRVAKQNKIRELEDALEDPDGIVFNGPDADGLRDLIGN